MGYAISEDYKQWLINTYFNDPDKRVTFHKGDELVKQGGRNDRLYLVRSGEVRGYLKNPDGTRYEFFCATEGMFAGLVSFFSRTCISASTVIAASDCELNYITLDQKVIYGDVEASLFDQFMPIVVTSLLLRRERERHAAAEHERAIKKLLKHQKLVSLGQMAAGLAHELNNAVAVLERNTQWLRDNLTSLLHDRYTKEFNCFKVGLDKGRCVSSSEVRKRTRSLKKLLKISLDDAEKLAEIGTDDDDLKLFLQQSKGNSDLIHFYWDMGATIHGMLKAASHASHVVNSVKSLGVARSTRVPDQNINESIKEAMTLLENLLKQVDSTTDFAELPPIVANKGELVQIWMNLIKNACESMLQAETKKPALTVSSAIFGGEIVIRINDNGPGIPEDMVQNIFQPNVSTKSQGLSFGLGLGLSIVERIIDSYCGEISLSSKPGETEFVVRIPIGDNSGKD